MKKSLFSTIGVGAAFLLCLAINYLAGMFPQRIDLTQEKAFTLSNGTKAILAKLDTPIQVRLYASRDAAMPPQLQPYVRQVEDLLEEYRQASRGMIEIEKLNPEPDSEAEDSARLDGVEGQMLPTGDVLYFGLSVSMLDRKEVIPFLVPSRERLLEYDLSRAITRVTEAKRPVIGLMTPLPIAGRPQPMMMMQPGADQRPWILYDELKRDFTLEEVPMTAEEIPENVQVLFLFHPVGITEGTQYAIDQFILRGGKLVAFLDSNAVLGQQAPPGLPPSGSSSNLEKLLSAWGITFDSTQVVVDMELIGRTRGGRMPGVLNLSGDAISRDDVTTADLDSLYMVFAGSFSGTPVEGLAMTPLVQSSSNSTLAESLLVMNSPDSVGQSFISQNRHFPVAIRLTGKFKTAFPDGKPGAKEESAEGEAAKTSETVEATPEPTPAKAPLTESVQENSVILVGDTDLLHDTLAVMEQQNPFTGQRMLLPANGNLALVQGALEQLSGDENLIAVRSRATRERPFTLVRRMEADASAVYQNKILELESNLSETQRKLMALQQTEEGENQRFILTPEQQAELEQFRKTESAIRRELKEVRRNLRSETDALETRVKWINIALAPTMVALTGLFLAALQRKRTAAR